MKKILVTGGAGFRLPPANYLSAFPYEITIIDNLSRAEWIRISSSDQQEPCQICNADLTAKDYYVSLADRYDYIYHLAAINGTKYFTKSLRKCCGLTYCL